MFVNYPDHSIKVAGLNRRQFYAENIFKQLGER